MTRADIVADIAMAAVQIASEPEWSRDARNRARDEHGAFVERLEAANAKRKQMQAEQRSVAE